MRSQKRVYVFGLMIFIEFSSRRFECDGLQESIVGHFFLLVTTFLSY